MPLFFGLALAAGAGFVIGAKTGDIAKIVIIGGAVYFVAKKTGVI